MGRRAGQGHPASRVLTRSGPTKRRTLAALAAVMVTIAAPFITIGPAAAGVGISPVPDFPTTVTVGETFTGRLNIINTSTPPESNQPVTVTNIVFVPACTNGAQDCAGGVDPGVFALSPTGVGSGGAANITFTITETAPGSGVFVFTPSAPLVLGAGQVAVIDFMVTTLKTPSVDVAPAFPGIQTQQVASATATSPIPGVFPVRGTGADTTTVLRAPTAITTVVNPQTATVGSQIRDTATVTGLVNPTPAGTVTFQLFSDPACTVQVFTSTTPLVPGAGGTGTATSDPYTVPTVGTYHWVATYSGDPNNLPAGPTACNDPLEQVVVTKANPAITTLANPQTANIGSMVTDTATVTGLVNPTPNGTVTFRLFSDPGCTVQVFTSTNPLVINPGNTTGTATSDPFTVTQAGTYHWVATYSGDVNNNPAGPTPCLDPAEQVVVNRANPTIATIATPQNATIGSTVTDTATVSGLVNPTPNGTVTFRLFSDPACTVQVFTSTNPLVIGPGGTTGTATSDPYTITTAGTYHWVATYSGDVNNNPAGPTPCLDPAEQVIVPRANPTIATVANPQAATVGTQLRDTATVSGLVNPTPNGTVTFQLFSDPACTVQVFTSTNPLLINAGGTTGTATSDPFTVIAVGTYHWVATYSGDVNNNPAGPTPCLDPAEQVVVTRANPALATVANPNTANIGDQIRDTATLTGGMMPTGTILFQLFNDPACTTEVFRSTNPVDPATGTAISDPYTVTAAGTYHWVATYSGDPNNNPAGPTACNDPAEQVVVNRANPTIATVASPTVPVGGVIFDTATVSGGSNPTGTVTFQLFSDPNCTVQVFSSTNPLDPVTRTARSGNYTTTAPGTYRWIATYNGDPNNNPAGPTACNDPAEQVVVTSANPVIATQASPAVPVGGQIFDTATVTGGNNPTGTVTFQLFGPNNATCAGPPIFTSTNALNPATGTAQSSPFTVTAPGVYRWIATYSGDNNNSPAGPTACNDPAEQVVVTQAVPAITTRASSPVNVGGTISDVATVTGLVNPTNAGTVTFQLFGPNNPTCTGAPIFTSTVPLDPATGRATSAAFTTTAPGTYSWIASYSGDVNNAPAGPTACNDPLEQVVVGPAGPSIVTQASPPVPVGGTITDTATLSGGTNPTGTITFTLFGPDNPTCTGAPIFTSTVPVSGNGNYTSGPFTVPAVGSYRWIATYSGDANNAAAGPTACADPLEVTAGNRVTPTIVTVASAGTLGGQVFDTATLSGGFNPTGTITFQLFGPNNETCTGTPVFTSVKPVNGNGNYTSDSFILPAPGVYHFVATYSGDANNNPAGPTACLDPNETVGVGKLPISIATQASGAVPVGGAIFDTATIAGGFNPTGTITFNLFGPDDATCAGPPAFTSTVPVNGNGSYQSTSFTPTAPGTYRWVASYSGDANNASAVTACNDPLEQVVVTGLPTIVVDKTATPESLPVPGGIFTFRVVVTNNSPVVLTIRSLTDNIYGDITKIPGSTCNTAIGTVLQPSPGPGNTYTCTFPGEFRGPGGASQTDIVTVTATDNTGNVVRDEDDAVVRITPVQPSITTVKTPSPTSLPEPGGTFTFTYTVTNTGPEPVTITSLVDDVYGNLNGRGTCAIGARLAANGGTYTCSFTGNFFGNAGASQTDTITTTAVNDTGQTVTSQAKATVTITNVPPAIQIVKTADPLSRPEPGGTFRFTVTITNPSFETVTTTSLVDDIYGNLNGRGSCAIGIVLAPNGGSYSCAFDGEFRGKAGDAQTDTVTVIGVDDEGTEVTAKAKATVTLTPVSVPPVVQPPPPPPAPRVLVRTGTDVEGPARLAGIMLLVGMTLVGATWWFGDGGPGTAPLPVGPGGGPGPGGGGHWFGSSHWFGGARVHPPRGPFGGAGVGLLDRPEEPEPEEPGPEAEAAAEATAKAQPQPVVRPEPVAEPQPVADLAWDEWVGDPRASATAPAEVTRPEAAVPEIVVPEIVVPEIVVAEAVVPEGVVPEAVLPEIVVPEAVRPTVVHVRATGALDAAALDAANAYPVDRRPEPPPGGRRSRRFGGR